MARGRGKSKIDDDDGLLAAVEEGRPEHVAVVAAAEPVSARQPGYGEFEIDIEEVLRQTLPSALMQVEAAPLNQAAVNRVPLGAKGAYMLFLHEDRVYAGKTDTRHGFRERLSRHAQSVQHRVGLNPADVHFKALRILVFSAFDVEAILINEVRRLYPNALRWNDSGFGSNDPGRKRDDGEPADFDKKFPIDIDIELQGISTEDLTVSRLLRAAKAASPYLLRHGQLQDYADTPIFPPHRPWTMRCILETVSNVLPSDFQVTIFHGRVILYRENKNYEFAREVMRGAR
jgi:hypothetical protein